MRTTQLPDSLPTAGWRLIDVSRRQDGPGGGSELKGLRTGKVPFTYGLAPQERESLPGYDSGVLCLLIGVFLLLASNFRHYSTYFKNFFEDLLSVRRKEKSFEEKTFSEAGVQMSVVLAACLSEAIILNAALWRGLAREVPGGEFTLLGGLMVLALLYYVWDLAAYTLVGAVFTDKVSAKMMMKGFNASQSLLAMLIVVPALIVLFNPSAAGVVAVLGIVSYVLTRVVFISKGFRLFYDNFGTWVYFILYLCSLEIVPLIIIYRAVRYITEMLLQN